MLVTFEYWVWESLTGRPQRLDPSDWYWFLSSFQHEYDNDGVLWRFWRIQRISEAGTVDHGL